MHSLKQRFRQDERDKMSATDHTVASIQPPEYPWERQPGERAFEAFARYRDLGPDRSLRRVGRDLGKSRAAIEELSVRWDWVARAFAYDAHLDRQRQIANERSFLEMNERHARLGQAMQTAGARKVEHVSALLDTEPTSLSPSEAVSMINSGQKLEREARGANIDTTEDPAVRVREFERIVLDAIDQADPDTGRRVREAIYRLGAGQRAN
jgi:hypothetical protein